MYLATNPPAVVMRSAQQPQYAPTISRTSSGSRRAERAVEPTRSQNMTVTWRRSPPEATAETAGLAFGEEPVASTDDGAGADAGIPSAAMASRNLRRWPTCATPRSFRSSLVSRGSTAPSIALSRKAGSYCSNPRPRSQAAIFMRRLRPVWMHDRKRGGDLYGARGSVSFETLPRKRAVLNVGIGSAAV